ncbi:MAG: dTMP kinase, partial [Acidimicrobiia bacterium]
MTDRQRGLLVAVLGPDGSGKSTLITGLEERLVSRGLRVHRFHLRPHFGRPPDFNGLVTDPHRKQARGPISSIAKLVLWWADYVIGHYIGVRPKLNNSGIVVFDRYYHDLLVDPVRYRYGSSLGLARLVGRLVPQPDLV